LSVFDGLSKKNTKLFRTASFFLVVLVVGVTVNWRSALLGALAAAATLALLVATLGVAIVQWVPIDLLRMVIGTLLLLFGLKWLKNAILRYSGLKARHDEQAIYEETQAELRARGEVEASSPRFDLFGFLLSYKSVLLEGLEVVFIVITFGLGAASSTVSRSSGTCLCCARWQCRSGSSSWQVRSCAYHWRKCLKTR
jgi:uncharacterized membrane protein